MSGALGNQPRDLCPLKSQNGSLNACNSRGRRRVRDARLEAFAGFDLRCKDRLESGVEAFASFDLRCKDRLESGVEAFASFDLRSQIITKARDYFIPLCKGCPQPGYRIHDSSIEADDTGQLRRHSGGIS